MRTPAASPTAARRIWLLAAQAFALGLLMSWILIPASAIFLSTYGPDLLPVTYLGAAVAGAASSAGVSRALRRRSLVTTAVWVLCATGLALLASWGLLVAGVRWLSFGLLVLAPIVVPMGFMFLVGQAGMLLDVRALKALYARVIAGFALGFVAGGLLAPSLLTALGGTEHLVLGAAAAAALWVGLLTLTRRQFRSELSAVEHDELDPRDAPTWGALLRDRFVALIVAFQMLSAVESQWLDYLVYERAAERYEDSQELARFISRFTAIAYGADIVFLLVIAGLLLRRFGLRYGLTANPSVVLGLVGGVVVLSSLQGAGATVVFVLIVTARVADLVLADGAARTSLSAAYQVVPTPLRLAAQAGVEGLAVPLAIGASGAVLLVLQATTGTGGVVLPLLVALVVATWLVVAVLVHRGYRVNLLESIQHRTLDPAGLSMDHANSLTVADQLLASDDLRDVRLGLDTLTIDQHPALGDRLDRLTRDARPSVRTDALVRLAGTDPARAAAVARLGLDDPDPGMRATSVQVLLGTGDPADLPAVEAHRGDSHTEVRVAVLAAVAVLGDDRARAGVSGQVAALAGSADPADRVLAARVLRAGASTAALDRAPLRGLLLDSEAVVANAAAGAVEPSDGRAVLDSLVEGLARRASATACAEALVRSGELALPAIDAGLARATLGRRAEVLLVRAGRDIGGPTAAAILARHVGHPDREVGLVVLRALGALHASADRGGPAPEPIDVSVGILADLEHATRALAAMGACAPHVQAEQVRAALRDEVDLLRRRVLGGLALHHGTEAMARVSYQLDRGDGRSHALALEWLEVTLTGVEKAAVGLIDSTLPEPAQLRRLERTIPSEALPLDAVLLDLIVDGEQRWRQPWLRACALHATRARPDLDLDLHLDLDALRRASSDAGLDDDGWSAFDEVLAALAPDGVLEVADDRR